MAEHHKVQPTTGHYENPDQPTISHYETPDQPTTDHYETPDKPTTDHYETPDLPTTTGTNTKDTSDLPRQFQNPVYGNEEKEPAVTDNHYSTVGEAPKEPERRFDNPIYGDDLQSNVYSQTTHTSTTTTTTTTQEQPGPLEPAPQYSTLESGPHYEMPGDGQAIGNGGSNQLYDDTVVPTASGHAPSAAIYNELEEHNYSVLERNH